MMYDTYGGNTCPITPLLVRGGLDVVAVSHARKLRPNFELARIVIDFPIPAQTSPAPQSPDFSPSIPARFLARLERKSIESARIKHLSHVIAHQKPDAIIAIDAELGLPIALKAANAASETRRPKLPIFCNSKGSDVMVVPNRKPALRRLISNALSKCAGILIYTEPHRAAVQALLPPQSPVRIWKIPATRDLSKFKHDDSPRSTAQNQGKPPLVLCLRGTTPVYRPEIMIEAAAIASQQTPLRLRFMATTQDADFYRNLWAAKGGNPANLELLTERLSHNKMPRQYAEATVVAQALLNESLGFTGIEATACGRIVVQPDSQAAREVLNPDQYGMLSGPSASEIAERLTAAIVDSDTRLKLEASNRAFAVSKYDENVVNDAAAVSLSEWLRACVLRS